MSATPERVEWTGTPSQWQNAGWFLACLLLIPIPWAIWRWLVVRNTVFTLTTERLRTRRGVFSRITEDLELYRVRDTKLEQTFFERMFGLGEVILYTTDASTPEVHIPWLKDAELLRETVRRFAEERRDAKRVRTFESGDAGPTGAGHDVLD
jgi:uncharacterized membrane protein YdbT with pleckstrin-like domain